MNEEKNPRGNTVLLTVIAVATLLVAVIGATFAYFTVTITGSENPTSVIVKTATLGITYTNGATISLDGLVPDDPRLYVPADPNYANDKVFTVRNDSTISMTYDIEWDVIQGNAALIDLKYSVTGSSNLGGTPGQKATPAAVPSSLGSSKMITGITILPGETQSYTLHIDFLDTSINQDAQQGLGFIGNISIWSDMV